MREDTQDHLSNIYSKIRGAIRSDINANTSKFNFDEERNPIIDIMRGIAMIATVIGHSMISNNIDKGYLYNLLCSFHMPLFFFVSGWVAYNKKINIKMSVKRLLLPMIFWGLIISYLEEGKGFSFGSIWFFWTLFVIKIIMKCIELIQKYIRREMCMLAFFVIAVFLHSVISINWLSDIGWYYMWYLAGDLCNNKGYDNKNVLSFFIIFIYFAFAVNIYNFYDYSPFLKEHLSNRIILMGVNTFLRVSLAGCGIYLSYMFSELLLKSMVFMPFYYIGKHTLEIYVMHRLFFYDFSMDNKAVSVFFQCVISLFACAIIITFYDKGLLDFFIFGRHRKSLNINKHT